MVSSTELTIERARYASEITGRPPRLWKDALFSPLGISRRAYCRSRALGARRFGCLDILLWGRLRETRLPALSVPGRFSGALDVQAIAATFLENTPCAPTRTQTRNHSRKRSGRYSDAYIILPRVFWRNAIFLDAEYPPREIRRESHERYRHTALMACFTAIVSTSLVRRRRRVPDLG